MILRSVARAVPFLGALLALAAAPPPARAQDTTPPRGVRIGLDYRTGMKPGVAVGIVRGAWGDSIRAIVQRDLDAGDRVDVLGAPGTPAATAIAQVGTGINYVVWKAIGAAAAVQLAVNPGSLRVTAYDVVRAAVLQTRDLALTATPGSADWREQVHAASDEMERWLTGTRGIAATRILFVRGGRVYVVDSDDWGERALTEAGTSLSPAWHPSGRIFAYSALGEHGWHIVLRDVAGGPAHVLAATTGGLNITPAFAPDGAALAYAHGEEDGTDLYVVALDGLNASGAARRVTVGRGTDNTSPTFSPEGRRLAFTSGRIGHPEVYVEDADGSGAELLTPFAFGEDSYRANPEWSPDGRQIAYQAQVSGVFQVMTISLRDRGVRQLTSEARNEDPSWAPDGRHLVFSSTRTGARELFVLDAESGRARQLTHGGGARLPAWSPALLTATP
jgi:TolB protein